jgi:hypothetical protein
MAQTIRKRKAKVNLAFAVEFWAQGAGFWD